MLRFVLVGAGLATLAACSPPRGVGFDDYAAYTNTDRAQVDTDAIWQRIREERGLKPSDSTQ